jgi:hypothetical protein
MLKRAMLAEVAAVAKQAPDQALSGEWNPDAGHSRGVVPATVMVRTVLPWHVLLP